MKFARRRQVEEPEAPADAPPPPVPPRDAPIARFAGVLDGRSLWLAIEARPGSLALRDTASGDVIALSSDLSDDQPGFRSIRVDLTELSAAGEAVYDVVLVPNGGRRPAPVWTLPLRPAVSPVREDGRWELRRTADGALQLLRTPVPAAAELAAVGTTPDGIRLTTSPAGDLALLAESGDEVVATFADQTLTAAALVGVADQMTRVTAGGQPVRRRDNDILDPGQAVPLPELYAVERGVHDHPRLRLRWSTDGLLLARILDPETAS